MPLDENDLKVLKEMKETLEKMLDEARDQTQAIDRTLNAMDINQGRIVAEVPTLAVEREISHEITLEEFDAMLDRVFDRVSQRHGYQLEASKREAEREKKPAQEEAQRVREKQERERAQEEGRRVWQNNQLEMSRKERLRQTGRKSDNGPLYNITALCRIPRNVFYGTVVYSVMGRKRRRQGYMG